LGQFFPLDLSSFRRIAQAGKPHWQNELEKRGYIYKSSYAGWYAVSDEAYYAENQVAETIDAKSGEKYMVSQLLLTSSIL
jgi:methionyl-tRNA synthetase